MGGERQQITTLWYACLTDPIFLRLYLTDMVKVLLFPNLALLFCFFCN